MTSTSPLRPEVVAGCRVFRTGSRAPEALFIAGPPLSAGLFRNVQTRMTSPTASLELVESGAEGLDALAAVVRRVAVELGATRVVAHGLAVPVALRLDGLKRVLLNGPTAEPDRVTQTFARLGPRVVAKTVLAPQLLEQWLASSLGLRRLVANPYAMDRDIVVALSRPVTATAETRRCAAAWVCDAGGVRGTPKTEVSEITAIWGDHDPLYPLAGVRRIVGARGLQAVPGGRHLFPEERPWELADRLELLIAGDHDTNVVV